MTDMNTYSHRRRSRRYVLGASLVLAVVSAMSYGPVVANAETAAPPAPAAAVPAPAIATTETAAVLDVERPSFIDINVRAFTPPQQGAVEAVVSLEEAKD